MSRIQVQRAAGIVPAGSISDTELGSPNNSVYKEIYRNAHRATTTAASATTYLVSAGSDVTGLAVTAAGALGPLGFYLDDADYLVAGLAQKLRLRVVTGVGGTPPAQTYTYTLNPLTLTGATITVGTAVASSTATVTTPSASTFTVTTSADFAIPADGFYGVTYTVSGTPSSNISSQVVIETRNV